MAAFKLALEAGADGIEFDVRLTRDGIPVVIHDESLQRTGKKNLRINELTLADLEEVEVGLWFTSGDFSGERLPTLQDVFDLFKDNDSMLYLEMKSSREERQALAEACCRSIKSNDLSERVIVESFDLPAIEIVKKIDSSIRTAALFEPSFATPPLLTSRRMIEAAKAVGADEVALHHSLATGKNVRAARDEGFVIVVWTVDSPAWVKRAIDMGISALITNDPALMLS
jgi:glycerophosphoryl diester phosphodiesterase